MEMLKKVLDSFDGLPDMVQAFIFVSLVVLFWEMVI
jgi:F0F1-type ATP synthase membrane subunit a